MEAHLIKQEQFKHRIFQKKVIQWGRKPKQFSILIEAFALLNHFYIW